MEPSDNKIRDSSLDCTGKFSHDSRARHESHFSEEYTGEKIKPDLGNPVPEEFLDRHFCQSSESMEQLPDNSVHLMITSPPLDLVWAEDGSLSFGECRDLLRRVWSETYRVLIRGGRACINVASWGHRPCHPFHSYIIEDMRDIGFFMRGEIIWNKGYSVEPSMAWGSWKSPNNPVIRDVHEYILVFCKDDYSRRFPDRESDLTREEFISYTRSVWDFAAVLPEVTGHLASFPVELPSRLIKLYSFEGEVVLDPFVGSGTTSMAAARLNRRYVGYEIDQEYFELANKRVGFVPQEIVLTRDS